MNNDTMTDDMIKALSLYKGDDDYKVDKDADEAALKALIEYGENFKKVGKCYFIDSGVVIKGPKSLSKS